jgi:hypothetical protein
MLDLTEEIFDFCLAFRAFNRLKGRSASKRRTGLAQPFYGLIAIVKDLSRASRHGH